MVGVSHGDGWMWLHSWFLWKSWVVDVIVHDGGGCCLLSHVGGVVVAVTAASSAS